jgi:serine/threonine protein kinase
MLRSNNNNNNNNKEEEEEEVRPIDGEYKKYTPPKPLHEQLNFSISDFVTVKHLGDGSYSEVRMVNFDALRLEGTEKSSRIRQEFLERPIALKVMDKKFIQRENKMSYVTKERDVLNAAEFTGICKLFFTFQDYYSLYLAMECLPEGDLAMLMKRTRDFSDDGDDDNGGKKKRKNGRLSAEQVTFYVKEVTEALRYCHETLRVAHRDVKPENILLGSDGHVKLCDFGSCIDLGAEHKEEFIKRRVMNEETGEIEEKMVKKKERGYSFVGSAEYCAPEILQAKAKATYACDVWSLGLTAYKLISGKNPFRRETEYLTMQAIEKEPEVLTYEIVDDVDDDDAGKEGNGKRFDIKIEDFCRQCIAYDWNERPTCEKLLNECALFKGLPDGEALWRADAPEFIPLAKEEEANQNKSDDDEDEDEDEDDDGYYESAEWKAKVAAALQKKLDKVDISGGKEE